MTSPGRASLVVLKTRGNADVVEVSGAEKAGGCKHTVATQALAKAAAQCKTANSAFIRNTIPLHELRTTARAKSPFPSNWPSPRKADGEDLL
jgi:hypothetical protein